MFSAGTFNNGMFAASHFPGASTQVATTTTVQTTWKIDGSLLVSKELDYTVKNAANQTIAEGTATTSVGGVLTVSIPVAYSQQYVLVFIDDVLTDMATTGKIYGAQVALAA